MLENESLYVVIMDHAFTIASAYSNGVCIFETEHSCAKLQSTMFIETVFIVNFEKYKTEKRLPMLPVYINLEQTSCQNITKIHRYESIFHLKHSHDLLVSACD